MAVVSLEEMKNYLRVDFDDDDALLRKRKVYVYIMHEDRPLGIPSYHYVETCLEGYRAFEFDENILFQAIEKSRRECHED